MHRTYGFDQQAWQTLEDKGWLKIIEEKSGDVYHPPFYSLDDAVGDLQDLVKEKYFAGLAKEQKAALMERIQALQTQEPLQTSKRGVWRLQNAFEEHDTPLDDQDLVVLTGVFATSIFSAVDVYGQDQEHPMDHAAFLSAAVYSYMHKAVSWRAFPHYSFRYTTQENRTYESAVVGTVHGDMGIYRGELTPLEATTPFDTPALFYPMPLERRSNILYGYHSAEPDFLAHMLTYARQAGVGALLTEEFCTELTQILQKGRNYTADDREEPEARRALLGLEQKLPPINQADEVQEISSVCFYGENLTARMYMGPDKELVFRQDFEGKPQQARVAMRIYPQEIPDLLRSLITHVAHGRSRTRPRLMEMVLEGYRAQCPA